MTEVTRSEIEQAVKSATGAPTVGDVAAITPAIVDAIAELLKPKASEPAKEKRIIKAEETPEQE